MSKRKSNKNNNLGTGFNGNPLMTVSEFDKTYGTGGRNGGGFNGNSLMTVAEFDEQQRQYKENIYRNQQRQAEERRRQEQLRQQEEERKRQQREAMEDYTRRYNELMLSDYGIMQPVSADKKKVSMSDFMNPFQRRSQYKKSAVKAGLWTQEDYDLQQQGAGITKGIMNWANAREPVQNPQAGQGAAAQDDQNLIYNKYFNQPNVPGMSGGMLLDDPQTLAQYYWSTKRAGTQKSTNPLNMGEQQLLEYLEESRKKLNTATANEEAAANRTAEEQAAAHDDTLLKAQGQRIFHELNTRGLPVQENMNGDLYVPDVEQWGGMSDADFIRQRPDDGGDYGKKTDNDALLYDAIYGAGAYEARWEEIFSIEDNAAADAEADKLDAEMDELWQRLENGDFEEEEQVLTNEYQESKQNEMGLFGAYSLQRQIKRAEEEQERQAKIAELEAAAPEGDGSFDESIVIWGLNQGAVDQVYYYANRPLTGSDFSHYGNMRPASFMLPEQVEKFNKYYRSGDKESAKAYYDALEPYLKQMQTIYKSYLEDKMSRNGYAPVMIANRVLTQPMAGLTGTIGTGLALFGNEDAQDPNSGWYSLARTNMNIQNARADVWGKQAAKWFGGGAEVWGQRLNGLLYSMADNIYAMALTGGAAGINAEGLAGKIAESTLQFIMSSEATATTMLERLDAGADPTEAALFSLGSGVIEWLTEKYSIEQLLRPDVKELLGNPKELIKYLVKNTAAEGSEEIASDVLGQTLDFVLSRLYGHESELEAQVSELKANNPEMSDEEAWKQVLLNFGGELMVSGGMGGLSGLIMSGGRGMLTRFNVNSQNKTAGQNILNSGVNEQMDAAETAAKVHENLKGLIDAAGEFEPGTEVREKADALQKAMAKGKKPDAKQVGSLYRSLMQQSGERVQGIASDIMGDVFGERLTELGEAEENIPQMQEALTNLVSGSWTDADLQAIAGSENAQTILSEYEMDDGKVGQAKAEMRAETDPFLSMQEDFSEKAAKPQTAAMAARATEAKMDGWKTAEKAQVLMAGGKTTGKSVMVDGHAAEVTGVTRTEDGGLQVNFANGESEAASEVRAVNEGMARTLKYLENDAGRTVGTNLANALVDVGSRSKNATQAVTDAMSIMWSQALGTKEGKTSLSTKDANAIREAVRKDLSAAEAKRTASRRAIKAGQGRTTFKGAEYGSEKFRSALKSLDGNVRNEAMAIASIAKSAGFDVELYYDKGDTANQGSFSASGGIRINLAGEFNTEGVRRSALATLSHEVTHWLEANSENSYKALRSFVVNNLQRSGLDVQAELNNIIETYGAHGVELDMSGAVAELVAKGCEQVLTNESVVQQLKEQDPTLHGKIKEAVKKLISRIRSALADATNTSSRYAKALAKYADELSRVWMETYNEAAGSMQETVNEFKEAAEAGDGKAANEALQHSLAEPVDDFSETMGMPIQHRKDGLVAMHNLSAERFMKALHIGGLAMPSTAVIPAGETWTQFSDISLFFGRETVDPNAGANMLFSGDAYTPMFSRDSGEFDTMESAMEHLKSQPVRMENRNINSKTLIRDYTRLGDIESGRALLYTYKNMSEEQRNKVWKDMGNLRTEILFDMEEFFLSKQGTIEKLFGSKLNSEKYEQMGYETVLDHALFNIYENIKTARDMQTGENERAIIVQGLQNAIDQLGDKRKYNFKKADKLIDSIAAYINYAGDNVGSEWLEAKPWRPVGFSEVKEVLMPKNVSKDVVEKAIECGIPEERIKFYENEGERETLIRDVGQRRPDAVFSIQEQDRQYEQAVKNGDWETAESMLLDKMQRTEGITGYNAPQFYSGEHKDIAKLIKSGDPKVIKAVVNEMAPRVPKNAVLIPMPPHEGKVLDSTDTMILAKAMSEATGRPVVNALESDFHESRYVAKASGKRNVNAKNMGFRQIADIPEGTMPVFIDNMVGGGQTAIAAKNAIGRGVTLAYAQSSRSKSKGVKFTSVTYDKNGKLIPLSQRMDPNNPSWKYSMQEQDDQEYLSVVKMGRYDLAEKMVDAAAKKAGYTIKAYHGTPNGKFNTFDKSKVGTSTDFGKLGRGFYFSNKKQVADYYAGYLNSSTVMPVYLKMENPFVLDHNYDNMSVREMYDSILGKGGIVDEQRSEELTQWLIDNGYDGIEADGEYMVLDPKNIKSAETVTYDNYGDVIPLSERFRTDHEENWKDKDIRFSIQELPNGEKYVNVDTDQKQFNGLKPKEMLKLARKIIRDKFINKGNNEFALPDSGKVKITTESADEYSYPSKRNIKEAEKRAKAKASPELDNLIKISKRLKPGDPLYPNPSIGHTLSANVANMRYYSTLFNVGGRWFTGIINIEENRNKGLILKDITQIKEDTSRRGQVGITPQSPTAKPIVQQVSTKKITQNNNKGKTQKSIQEQDDQYKAAVKSGDMETAQRIVDNVAKEKGFTEKVYHGTPTGGFTVFRDWSYFTKSKAYADRYRHTSASSIRSYSVDATQPRTYELYMNPGKVFDTRNPEAARIYNEARMEYGLGELSNTNSGLPDWTDGRDIIEFIEDKGLDYDTILLDEGADPGENGPVSRGISYVTRNNRVKSAEAVTYDNKGKEIPPSERFNVKENDIRFSMQENVEVNRDGLIAVHNLTWEELWDTMNEGGITAPSIAVVKAKTGHTKYGPISVILKPGSIDPRNDRRNKIYGADAYTPTRYNAHVETELDYKKSNKIADELSKLVEGEDKHLSDEIRRWFSERAYRETTTKNPAGMAEDAYNNEAFMGAFLKSQGKEIPIKTRDRYVSENLRAEDIESYHEAFELILKKGIKTAHEFLEDVGNLSNEELIEKYGEVIAPANERIQTLLNVWNEKKLDLAERSLIRWMERIRDYIQGGSEKVTETDWYETRKAMWDMVDKKEFVNWLAEKISPMFGQKGIRNNLDPYTYSGESRTFRQLHMPYTIENVVKAMYKNAKEKGEGARYATGAIATASKEYRNLDEVRADSDRLRFESDEKYEEIIKEFNSRANELAEEIIPNNTYAFEQALIEAGRYYAKSQTLEAIRKGFAAEGVTATKEQLQKTKELLEDMREIPTGYFEAKPMRIMGFDEIAKVIVPESAGSKMFAKLEENNIPYETYDGTDEDRLRIMNEQEDAKFSIMDETDVDARAWMETVQESSLQTEAEKSLLRNFKALRMRVSLKQEQERKYSAEIARLEAIPEGERTREQKSRLDGYKIRLKNATTVKQQAEEELAKITSSNGYVSMMYRQQRVLNDFVYGRTQEEVRSAVERLDKSAENIEKRIQANREAAEALEKSGIVDRFRKVLGTTTADQTAAELKKAFNSTWTKGQIKTFLDPIITKMVAGEDFQQDVEELAGILVNSDSTNTYEELSGLRGLTITIGKGALAELRAQNSSLKEVRARLAGTGITVKSGERSTLEADIEDLRAEYPSMPELGDEKDALNNFLDWIDGMKQASAANEFYEQRIAEAMAVITGKAAGAAKGIYMPNDAKAQKQVLAMMDFVKSLNAETAKAQQDLQEIADDLAAMRKAGQQASGMANTMAHDANVALDYFNKMARIAEDTAKQKTRKDLVAQLKSDFTKKIAKNNEEWRNLIARDRDARKQLETNRAYANRINTVLKRAYKRLKEPKAMKNVPEYMQGLAREMLGIFVDNDLAGGKRFTTQSREALTETRRVLDAWIAESGAFDRDSLKQAHEAVEATLSMDLMVIRDGIAAINSEIKGKNKVETLEKRGEILKEMQEAVSEIWSAVMKENQIFINGKNIEVEDEAYKIATQMGNRHNREWTGKLGGTMRTLHRAIVSGNMTPEYFFRTIGNAGMNDLWNGYHEAENRNGLELAKAKARLSEIAEKHGYSNWDVKQKVTLDLNSGAKVQMTIGQLMSLYATWKRETTLGPAVSEHLAVGGFYAEQDLRDGLIGKTTVEHKAHRIAVERNEKGEIVASPDMQRVEGLLTEEQKQFVDEMVGFMSSDMSELGNEASMNAYGIKMYKESYYFPFQMWNGIKSRKSNDSGSAAAAQDRAFHPSFSKSRLHGANNALMIGDFMQTVADHVAGMINYATMGLANENMQKAMNFQLSEEDGAEEINKRNVWTMFEEAYGMEAAQYLRELQQQLNGGAVKTSRNLGDKLISLFRKNAVAGSLSVALQQPMSYIRAAVMVNPKYLAAAMNPATWKGSYKEMMEHSGVAVIKDMGRFDMNFGQSAREYLMPEAMQSRKAKVWNGIEEYSTILPELMDRMTWTRMWSACKAEMKAQNPEMDVKSDEFLNMVGERFNDLMRRTQVYDSVLVKSANMRNDNYFIKSMTSFMAEPTLTLNVLADAARQAKSGEKGGKLALAKAGATFALSAVLQAAIKGLMGSGRTPDDKKTWEENFWNKFVYNFVSEIDPLQLIPGFSDMVTILKGGELKDDAFGTLSKLYKAGQGAVDILLGKSELNYRNIEDSAAQIAQLFTGVPAKNIMRDMRAMWNWVIDRPYADRETSGAVIRNQTLETVMNADNVLGIVNKWLGDAGYATDNSAYYKRIYDAKRKGNEKEAEDLIDYLLTGGKVKKRETIDSKVAALAKEDESTSAEEKADFLIGEGADADDFIRDQLRTGTMTAEEARRKLKEADPDKTDEEIWWAVDRVEYQIETGAEKSPSGYYYRLKDAISEGKSDKIRAAVKTMKEHGYDDKKLKSWIGSKNTGFKTAYLEAKGSEKVKIKNSLIMAYKAVGLSEDEANEIINKWGKDSSSEYLMAGRQIASGGMSDVGIGKKKTKYPELEKEKEDMYKYTSGQYYGYGNIDLNHRKVVHNPDGSISTEKSITLEYDGVYYILPTVINGKIVSQEEAERHFERTGEHLGAFDDEEEANEYAQMVHERQDWYYHR